MRHRTGVASSFSCPRPRLVAGIMGIFVLVLAGCGGEGTGQDAAGGTGGGQKLVFVSNQAPRTLDISTVDDRNTDVLLKPDVYEGLTQMRFDSGGKLEWVPTLATKWDTTTPTTWRFTLRQDVKFHDGHTLTADDVVYSINRRLDPSSEPTSTIANIKGATKVDDMTVDVESKAADPYVFRTMSVIPITPDKWGDDKQKAASTADGTGPYKLDSYTNGGNNAALTQFDGYWGDKAHIPEVDMRVIPEAATAISALQTGEVNVVRDITPDLAGSVPAIAKVTSIQPLIGRIGAQNPPYTDVQLRKAMNMAIDQASIIKNIYKGYAVPFHGQIVPPVALGFNPDVNDPPFDPDGARALIQQAGAAGAPVTIMCSPDRYGTTGADVCNTVGQMLDNVGLKSQITMAPTDQWTASGMNAKTSKVTAPDVFIAGAGTESLDGSLTMRAWLTCDAARNQLCDPALQDQISAASAIQDRDARTKAIQALEVAVQNVEPWIGLPLPDALWGTTANVTGPMFPTSENVRWADWTFK
jgi:peptide/nickel transport system substrate-binding protein